MTLTSRLAWPTAIAVAVVVVLGFLGGVHLENLHNGLLGLSFAFVGAFVIRHAVTRTRRAIGRAGCSSSPGSRRL